MPGTVRVLSLDPELGAQLSPGELRRASPRAIGRELRLPCGSWEANRVRPAERSGFGVLLLSGIVARDMTLAGHVCTELLGHGDVLNPWRAAHGEGLLPTSLTWTVLEPVRLAVLDPSFVSAVCPWPSIIEGLFARANRRCLRLGLHQAIAQLPRVDLRLLALFWLLADRWGRIGHDGVVLPIALPHHMLGRLIGARRPTVSLALRELAERGHVHRRPDGSWRLARVAPEELLVSPEPGPTAGGHATTMGESDAVARDLDAVDRMAAELILRTRRLQGARGGREAGEVPGLLDSMTELRERLDAARAPRR